MMKTKGQLMKTGSFWERLLIHDDSGVYTVEFALLAVPFFGLLMAYGELSYIDFSTQVLIDQLQKATRVAQTGQAQTDSNITSGATFISNALCPSAGSTTNTLVTPSLFPNIFDCTNLLRIDITRAASIDVSSISSSEVGVSTLIGKSEGQLNYCLALPNTVVVLRALYYLPAILPLSIYGPTATLTNNTGGGNSPNTYYHVIFATSAIQTENYTPGTYTLPSGC